MLQALQQSQELTALPEASPQSQIPLFRNNYLLQERDIRSSEGSVRTLRQGSDLSSRGLGEEKEKQEKEKLEESMKIQPVHNNKNLYRKSETCEKDRMEEYMDHKVYVMFLQNTPRTIIIL